MGMYDFTGRGVEGGVNVEPGRFGYTAAVVNSIEFAADNRSVCGGALIAPNIVLTTARCSQLALSPYYGSVPHVLLGCEDMTDPNNCEAIRIRSGIEYPEYFEGQGNLTGDVQLLILEEDSVQEPVAVATPEFDLIEGQDLTTLGWGKFDTSAGEDRFSVLQEINVEITSLSSCNDQYRAVIALHEAVNFSEADFYSTEIDNSDVIPVKETIVTDLSFCTQGEEGKDVCRKDVGNPSIQRCDATGEDVLLGLVSFGEGCAADGLPRVQASVSHPKLFAFIDKIVSQHGHTLKKFTNAEEFCLISGTKPAEALSDPPTPFPTFEIAGWTCHGSYFANGDACDCNCGIPDPDCSLPNLDVFNCQDGQICVNAVCTDPLGAEAPTSEDEAEELTHAPSCGGTDPAEPNGWFGDLDFTSNAFSFLSFSVLILIFSTIFYFYARRTSLIAGNEKVAEHKKLAGHVSL